MARLPKVAIVGRPNVGKSALFNRILKKRIAIVDEAEGITRDRLYAEAECFGRHFELIDTGGIDPRSDAPFNEQIRRQAEIAIEEADSLIMVVDCRCGVVDLDREVARILQQTEKPLTLAVNKIDGAAQADLIHEFHSLGIPEMVAVSATQTLGLAELLESALDRLPEIDEEEEDPSIKVAIIGRPNVGKSTFINTLLEEERCVVSPIAGTTRDSIDIAFEVDGEPFTLIDTAGIRKKNAEHEVVDKFAAIRTQRAIERADVCVLMLDAQQGLTSYDKRIATMIEEEGKGCVLALNKWDLVKGFRMEHALKGIRDEAHFLEHCPAVVVSALKGRNLDKIFTEVKRVAEAMEQRVGTGQLNRFIEKMMQLYHPPRITGKRLKVFYMTQVQVGPPRFLLFVNNPNLMTDTYKRYLTNRFREQFTFAGVPIEIHLKGRVQRKGERTQMRCLSDRQPVTEGVEEGEPVGMMEEF